MNDSQQGRKRCTSARPRGYGILTKFLSLCLIVKQNNSFNIQVAERYNVRNLFSPLFSIG